MINSKLGRAAVILAVLTTWIAGAAVAADLDGPVSVVFDQHRVPTIVAETEHDAIYMQGYMHARDRLWQMDYQRRLFSGTLSEMLGSAAIPTDVQLRTLGLRRAAERGLAVQTPETTAWLQAYADGVNAFLGDPSNPLPLEYSLLELDRGGIPPWTTADSLTMVKGLAFGLSFGLEDIDQTLALLNFRGVGEILGFNGFQLYGSDLYRTAPFDPSISIPPSAAPPGPDGAPPIDPATPSDEEYPEFYADPNFNSLVQDYRDAIVDIPMLNSALEGDYGELGSNWWVLSGANTESGYPMLTNDPHLALDTPATFYEVNLNVIGGINVTGVSFPGAPGVVQGCNNVICWGSTVNPMDVTDVYQEVLLPLDPSQPTTPTHTLFDGAPEPLQFIPQVFRTNVIGNGIPNTIGDVPVPADQGGVTLVVPRRNNGPIVQVSFDPASPTPLTGISVQYVGWSATQELETFRRFARATSTQEFKDALQYFDVGSQNWAYADINGNIAYYTSGELPIREDLQTLFFPAGLIGPYWIRDGTHTSPHEWMPLSNPQPHQALGTEILPFSEMPQVENPASGVILNANNDPIGTSLNNISWDQFRPGFNGLLYLSPGYATGFRMGRIQRLVDDLLAGGGKLSRAESIAIQANNQLLDAEVLTPHLLQAYANATAPGAPPELAALAGDPRVAEAAGRIAEWDFSTPTGIDVGFDPGDNPAAPGPPSQAEIDASVAATIYSVWRGQVVQRVIDGTLASLPIPLDAYAPPSSLAMSALRRLLDIYHITGGTGSSLINFFQVPGVADQFVARDIILLQGLQNGLNLLASDEMAPAFGNSTNLEDYRWGYLHRIVFSHPMGPALSIPPAGSPLNVSPDLSGVARAGGFGAVDASSHSARSDSLNGFMFGSGPNRRVVATMTPQGPDVLEVIPGGQSGAPGSPYQTDQLFLWLVNLFHPLPIHLDDVLELAEAIETYDCGDSIVGPGEECDDGNTNDNDGCTVECRFAPIITCGDPTVPADAETCTADTACDVIASCIDPAGGSVTFACAPSGPYDLGTTDVGVVCDAASATTTMSCPVTVVDVTPPALFVTLDPDELWPPNHRMVDVTAMPAAWDSCGATSIVLESIVSSEPDNGRGDGNTVDDVQGGEPGTNDVNFALRAERAGSGPGRVYTVTYTATDSSGNQAIATAAVTVPHDQGGVTEPLMMSAEETASGTSLHWNDASGSSYNVIRGKLSELADAGVLYDLGPVTCIEAGSSDASTVDLAIPAAGEVFIYMVEFDTGNGSSYGTESAAKPRVPGSGDCGQ